LVMTGCPITTGALYNCQATRSNWCTIFLAQIAFLRESGS
jgi:hypothetical protein